MYVRNYIPRIPGIGQKVTMLKPFWLSRNLRMNRDESWEVGDILTIKMSCLEFREDKGISGEFGLECRFEGIRGIFWLSFDYYEYETREETIDNLLSNESI